MDFSTPPNPGDMFEDGIILGPEPTAQEIERQRAWREHLEEYARSILDWWRANQPNPIPEADPTIVIGKQKLTLSKATLIWFEEARQKGQKDAGEEMARYILSKEFREKLQKR